jgi:hypothetical protein
VLANDLAGGALSFIGVFAAGAYGVTDKLGILE